MLRKRKRGRICGRNRHTRAEINLSKILFRCGPIFMCCWACFIHYLISQLQLEDIGFWCCWWIKLLYMIAFAYACI